MTEQDYGESILDSVKESLGIVSEDVDFDTQLIMHINSIFAVLHQIGIGPTEPFSIYDSDATWGDFIGDEAVIMNVKSYMYARVRLIFDPPSSSFVLDSLQKLSDEMEWRLNVAADHSDKLD